MGSGRTAGTPAEVTPPVREHPQIPAKGEPYYLLVVAFVERPWKEGKLIWHEWVADPGEEAFLWVAHDPNVVPRNIVDYCINAWYGTPTEVTEMEL